MKATITSIELRGPLKFFLLSSKALKIIRQLKNEKCIDFKKRGLWTKHYTMSLWKSEEDIKAFLNSGAHLEAMKESKNIAKRLEP